MWTRSRSRLKKRPPRAKPRFAVDPADARGDNRARLRDLYRQFAQRRKENRAQTPNEFIAHTLGDSTDAASFAQGMTGLGTAHAVSDEEVAAAARAVAAQSAK